MKIVIAFSILFISAYKSFAQDLIIDKIKTFGGKNNEMIFSNSSDIKNENILLTGYFIDTLKIDDKSIISQNRQSCFISKFDTSYNLIWLKKIQSNGSSQGKVLKIDKNNDIVIGGLFKDILIVGSDTLISTGYEDIFIIKMNQTGNVIWSRSLNSIGYTDIYDLDIDKDNNIYFSGFFQDQLIFIDDTLKGTQYSYEGILMKLNPNGEKIWTQQFGGQGTHYPYSIAIDDNSIWTSGSFAGTLEIEDTSIVSNGYYDGFISNFNCNGELKFIRNVGGKRSDEINAIECINGKAYFAGDFTDTILINGLIFHANEEIMSDGIDAFYANINSNGKIEWFKTISGDLSDFVSSISIMNKKDLIITGYFMSDNIIVGDTTFHSSLIGQDSYIAKFDTSGNFVSALFLDSDYSSAGLTVISSSDNIHFFGYSRGNSIINNISIDTNENSNIFMIKIKTNNDIVISACNNSLMNIVLYPNPCNDYLIIKSDEIPQKVNLYNSYGILLSSSNYISRLYVGNFNAGIYFIEVIFHDSKMTKKILITH
jgi:hypothetical protein